MKLIVWFWLVGLVLAGQKTFKKLRDRDEFSTSSISDSDSSISEDDDRVPFDLPMPVEHILALPDVSQKLASTLSGKDAQNLLCTCKTVSNSCLRIDLLKQIHVPDDADTKSILARKFLYHPTKVMKFTSYRSLSYFIAAFQTDRAFLHRIGHLDIQIEPTIIFPDSPLWMPSEDSFYNRVMSQLSQFPKLRSLRVSADNQAIDFMLEHLSELPFLEILHITCHSKEIPRLGLLDDATLTKLKELRWSTSPSSDPFTEDVPPQPIQLPNLSRFPALQVVSIESVFVSSHGLKRNQLNTLLPPLLTHLQLSVTMNEPVDWIISTHSQPLKELNIDLFSASQGRSRLFVPSSLKTIIKLSDLVGLDGRWSLEIMGNLDNVKELSLTGIGLSLDYLPKLTQLTFLSLDVDEIEDMNVIISSWPPLLTELSLEGSYTTISTLNGTQFEGLRHLEKLYLRMIPLLPAVDITVQDDYYRKSVLEAIEISRSWTFKWPSSLNLKALYIGTLGKATSTDVLIPLSVFLPSSPNLESIYFSGVAVFINDLSHLSALKKLRIHDVILKSEYYFTPRAHQDILLPPSLEKISCHGLEMHPDGRVRLDFLAHLPNLWEFSAHIVENHLSKPTERLLVQFPRSQLYLQSISLIYRGKHYPKFHFDDFLPLASTLLEMTLQGAYAPQSMSCLPQFNHLESLSVKAPKRMNQPVIPREYTAHIHTIQLMS